MQPKPSTDRIALIAIAAAMLAIVWAKVEFLGTRDLESMLSNDGAPLPQHCDVRRLEAVTMNRWAGGFNQ